MNFEWREKFFDFTIILFFSGKYISSNRSQLEVFGCREFLIECSF